MSRRIALPGADELFRSTGDGRDAGEAERAPDRPTSGAGGTGSGSGSSGPSGAPSTPDARPASSGSEHAGQGAREDAQYAWGERDADSPAQQGEAQDGEDLALASASVRSAPRRRARAVADRRPSGRERHDEKITVYVSADELMDLEHARLALRGDHGLPVDRGRVVREALAVVLADFEAKGEASILVRRLRGR